jgi:hypothetical protein
MKTQSPRFPLHVYRIIRHFTGPLLAYRLAYRGEVTL